MKRGHVNSGDLGTTRRRCRYPFPLAGVGTLRAKLRRAWAFCRGVGVFAHPELPSSLGALAPRPLRRLWGARLLLAQLLLAQLLYHLPADFFESQFVSIQAE